jgi:hypothetical protein
VESLPYHANIITLPVNRVLHGGAMPQTAPELKKRVEDADLWPESTNADRCDNCRYYIELREGIGYCAHRQLDMVVGSPWWCKLWAPNRATAAERSGGGSH